MCCLNLSAQSLQVSGQVIDNDKLPVIGATVIVKGKTVGTVTDIDGNYALTAAVGDILEVTFVGYDTKTITVVNGTTQYNFQLSSGLALDEVVVVGFGTQKKVDLTGAVSRVN
ncbi:MAG TPA: carboxypeptidase-like regulatory domain-containing protein, partial [Saprospiraceae bacterium]|nr:carboxypeptidase-like regulatory domain-containing protein [Saprospiraceae bacterium]